jgi:hypothetical protein
VNEIESNVGGNVSKPFGFGCRRRLLDVSRRSLRRLVPGRTGNQQTHNGHGS